MSEAWTIKSVLTWTSQHFEKRGIDSPRLTAEVLLAHALATSRVRLYVDYDRPLSKDELGAVRVLISKRVEGQPTQYLTGVREFYNRPFAVDPRVLIPRPETELLAEAVLSRFEKSASPVLLDLCTGSGCIAITLAAERPQSTVHATDVSEDALTVARANAENLKVAERMTFHRGDLFAALAPGTKFDAIVSNPPYVASGEIETLSAEVKQEPRLALDGGTQGLDFIQTIAREAKAWLLPAGFLALEIGETQGAAVRQILQRAGWADVNISKDGSRSDRFAVARAELPVDPITHG